MDYDGHGVFGCVSEATKYHSNRQRPTLDEATVLAYLRPISALCTLGSPSPRQSGPTARRGGDEKVDIPPASTKAPGNWSPPRRGHVRSTRCHGPVGPTPGDAHRTRFGSSRGGGRSSQGGRAIHRSGAHPVTVKLVEPVDGLREGCQRRTTRFSEESSGEEGFLEIHFLELLKEMFNCCLLVLLVDS